MVLLVPGQGEAQDDGAQHPSGCLNDSRAIAFQIQGPDFMKLAAIGDAIKQRIEELPPGYDDPWVWLSFNKPQLEVEIDRELDELFGGV